MNLSYKKLFAAFITIQFMLILMIASSMNIAKSQATPIIRIMDAETGLTGITLGSETEPTPLGGYPFTVNVTLDGLTEDLFTYQIVISFDTTKINCIAAWIPTDDPNFVFYGKRIVLGTANIAKANEAGYIVLGASLQQFGDSVNVSQGIFCQINFTTTKKGTSTLSFIPTGGDPYDTFLWDNLGHEIPFTSESFSVTVFAGSSPPVASFTFDPQNPKVNETVTFDGSESYDPDGNITLYVWDFGDDTNAAVPNSTTTHNYTSFGSYLVNLTVTDNAGLYNSIAKDVLIGTMPCVNFTYDWEQKDEYPLNPYRDITVTFNASACSDPDGTVANYTWNFGDGNNATTTNVTVTHIFASNGIYHVKLTVFDNDGLYNSTAQYIFVGIRPHAEFTFSPETPNPDEDVLFVAYDSSRPRELSYDDIYGSIVHAIWDFGDLEVIEVNVTDYSLDLIASHVYIGQGGGYSVNLTVFDDDGLYASVVHDIDVTVIEWERTVKSGWESYAVAGIVFGAIILVAVWYKRRPEKKLDRRERYRVI